VSDAGGQHNADQEHRQAVEDNRAQKPEHGCLLTNLEGDLSPVHAAEV